jgi:hypothetical protein
VRGNVRRMFCAVIYPFPPDSYRGFDGVLPYFGGEIERISDLARPRQKWSASKPRGPGFLRFMQRPEVWISCTSYRH